MLLMNKTNFCIRRKQHQQRLLYIIKPKKIKNKYSLSLSTYEN